MAPKAGKKKKSKEEIEAERLAAEEAARLAEEERLRAEEEERQRLAELEAQRQALLAEYLDLEAGWLGTEHAELQPLLQQYAHQRARASEERAKQRDWERFTSCVHVPLPTAAVEVATFLKEQAAARDDNLAETFAACQDCYDLGQEARLLAAEAAQEGDESMAQALSVTLSSLHATVGMRVDRVTAHVLAHADEHANDRGEIQLGLMAGAHQWALWVNTSKNPRLKQVELPQLNAVVDVPKTIALANIALRVQRRLADEFFERCTNQYMAVGGVLYADLLALPPPAKKVRGWTLRQVTPLSSAVQRVPYPIPPAGADPATYRAEEEPPPLGFTYVLSNETLVLDSPPQVGWWDSEQSAWSTEGVSDISYEAGTCQLSFKTTHLAPLALLTPRSRLLPYKAWNCRPTGGRNGRRVALTLDVGISEPLVFEVGPGSVALSAPSWLQLSSLCGVPHTQGVLPLLHALSARGLHLLPQERDAGWAGVVAKDRAAESALCADLAMISGVFLLASSRWNQSAAHDECMARVSEVCDWEGGGRTEPHHLARVFDKEKEEGERRVLVVVQRGAKGAAFSDCLNRRETYQPLPGVSNVEEVEAMKGSVFGEVHASLLALLRGQFQVPGAAEDPNAARLCAAAESLELCRNTDPLMTQTLTELMLLLRLFSFG